MNGIGIRKQTQPVMFREAVQELVGEDRYGIQRRVPNVGEFLKIEGQAKALREVEMPVPRRHAPFLPVAPVRIVFDGGPKLFGREGKAVGEAHLGPTNIYAHENAADVEDYGAKLGGASHLLPASGIEGRPPGRPWWPGPRPGGGGP